MTETDAQLDELVRAARLAGANITPTFCHAGAGRQYTLSPEDLAEIRRVVNQAPQYVSASGNIRSLIHTRAGLPSLTLDRGGIRVLAAQLEQFAFIVHGVQESDA